MINRSRRVPFLTTYQEFSIAVSRGATWHPTEEEIRGATGIPASIVADRKALFVADPFLATDGLEWHLFFEAMDRATLRGSIGLAASRDRVHWEYRGIVLEHDFHVSFPHVFAWQGSWWMIPETSAMEEVRLYRADPFPERWRIERVLLTGRYSDSVVFPWQGSWYMLTSPRMETLCLFVAPEPVGPWVEHPLSPLVDDDLRAARPAGPVVQSDGRLFRLAQDCSATYGLEVSAFEILDLSNRTYTQAPRDTILSKGRERWRACGMHHLSGVQGEGGWTLTFDGWRGRRHWGRLGL